MADHSEACRANALRCFEVAEKTHAPEDRLEFIGFAESWERLAKEIERNQLLIMLIDELAASSRTNDTQLEPDELTEFQRSGTWSLQYRRKPPTWTESLRDSNEQRRVDHRSRGQPNPNLPILRRPPTSLLAVDVRTLGRSTVEPRAVSRRFRH
jgi:hypothetical protein